MGEVKQAGWTRFRTAQGRYEYQFQGRVPAVRAGRYEDAADFQFLVMDEEGWLFKIPVRIAADAESLLGQSSSGASATQIVAQDRILQAAEAQLRAGLEIYQPRSNAPYAEIDSHFAMDAARAREIANQR
jgi:hypothetical protein